MPVINDPTPTPESEAARLLAKFPGMGTLVGFLLLISFLGTAINVGPVADLINAATRAQNANEATQIEAEKYFKVSTQRVERLEAEAAARAAQ